MDLWSTIIIVHLEHVHLLPLHQLMQCILNAIQWTQYVNSEK